MLFPLANLLHALALALLFAVALMPQWLYWQQHFYLAEKVNYVIRAQFARECKLGGREKSFAANTPGRDFESKCPRHTCRIRNCLEWPLEEIVATRSEVHPEKRKSKPVELFSTEMKGF